MRFNKDTMKLAATSARSVSASTVNEIIETFALLADSSQPACTQADVFFSGTPNSRGLSAVGTSVGSWSAVSLRTIGCSAN